jgi:hypothetical protein
MGWRLVFLGDKVIFSNWRTFVLGLTAALLLTTVATSKSYGDDYLRTGDQISDYFSKADHIKASVSETLEHFLPRLHPFLRGNFAMLYEPAGKQKGSLENPRFILYEWDGSLFLSFSLHPSGGKHQLVLELNAIRGEDQFATLSALPLVKTVVSDIDQIGQSCSNCHESIQAPKLRWHQYAKWPGSFNSLEEIFLIPVNLHNEMYRDQSDKAAAVEEEALIDLYNRSQGIGYDQHPVYRHLDFSNTGLNIDKNGQATGMHHTASYRHRINNRLTKTIARRQAHRNFLLMKESTEYDKWALTVIYLRLHCLYTKLPPPLLQLLDISLHHGALDAVFEKFGFDADSFSAEFPDPIFSYLDGSGNLTDYVAGLVFRDLKAKYPELDRLIEEYDLIFNGELDDYSRAFADTLFALAPNIRFRQRSREQKEQACTELAASISQLSNR